MREQRSAKGDILDSIVCVVQRVRGEDGERVQGGDCPRSLYRHEDRGEMSTTGGLRDVLLQICPGHKVSGTPHNIPAFSSHARIVSSL